MAGASGARPATLRPDQFSSEGASHLKAALARQPAVRPEVVERAKLLVADLGYPSAAVIRHVASQILASPDLSEEQG